MCHIACPSTLVRVCHIVGIDVAYLQNQANPCACMFLCTPQDPRLVCSALADCMVAMFEISGYPKDTPGSPLLSFAQTSHATLAELQYALRCAKLLKACLHL